MTDVDPEKATIGDLFRLMTDMRGEMSDLRSEMNARLDDAAGEREAIRNVVDTLPSYEMVESIETAQNRMTEDIATARSSQHQATTFQRQTVSRLDRIEAGQEKVVKSLDRAGIPVR